MKCVRFCGVFGLGVALCTGFALARGGPVATVAAGADPAATLAARIADQSRYGSRRVVVGAVAPGLSASVPLPANRPVLGTVVDSFQGTATVFYQPEDAAAARDAYVKALAADGFALQQPRRGFRIGWARSGKGVPVSSTFCKGLIGVTVTTASGVNDDLRVEVPLGGKTMRLACGPQRGQAVWTPLPWLVAPAKAEILNGRLGGWEFSSNLVAGQSGATVVSSLPLPQLAAAFAKQFTAARWRIVDRTFGTGAAAATFSYDSARGTWRAVMVLYAAPDAKTYYGLVNVRGTPGETNPTPAPMPKPVLSVRRIPRIDAAKANEASMLLAIAQRVATDGYTHSAQVYARRLPPDMVSGVPLPTSGTLLGSLSTRPSESQSVYLQPSDTLYYLLTSAHLSSYKARLRSDGWAPAPPPPIAVNAGGFVATESVTRATYCKTGFGPLSVSQPSADPAAVTIAVTRGTRAPNACQPAYFPNENEPPWPNLTMPGGVVSRAGAWGATRNFGELVTKKPLRDVLGDLAAQFVRANWSAGPVTVAGDLAAQTFFYNVQDQHWKAVLTISKSQKPGTYDAYVNAGRTDR